MALSRDWTAIQLVNRILLALNLNQNCDSFAQRFDILNYAFSTTANLFYDLMSNAYMTPVTLLPNTIGRYSASGTGTWTAATNTLVFSTMNTSFGSGDVGNLITFTVGSNCYVGQISQYVSGTTVVVTGNNLPATNQTVTFVIMCPTAPTASVLSLVGLRIMRTGQPIKIELETTATQTLEPTTSQGVFKFDSTIPQNANKIVWAYSGEQILLAKGNGLATYGTFTMRYPRVPYLIANDTDNPDLPDGAAIEIGYLYAKYLFATREDKPTKDYEMQVGAFIQALYKTFGEEVKAAEIQNKVQVLK